MEKTVTDAFGYVIRELRVARGVSQEWVGVHASLQRKYISRLELGANQASLETVFKVANAFDLSPNALVAMVEAELKR